MADDAPFVYHLQEILGRGGFGTVYRAELRGPRGFSKVVAVKLLNRDAEQKDEVVQRLRDEARMLGLIQHRAIVQVDRLVQLDGRWAVVMEYVPGFDLHEILHRAGPLPLGPALEVAEEVASALHVAYASALGVGPDPDTPLHLVHRDVKPANIRVTRSGAVKLLDFGIARARFPGREARTESIRFGSMNYMSPMRLAMSDDGHAGDMYALGAVLLEILTGQAVGMTSHHPSAHQEIVNTAMNRLRDGGFSEPVAALVESALAYDPEDRPDARTFLNSARLVRNLEVPEHSLLEWVDNTFPALDAIKVPPQHEPSEDMESRVLFEAAPVFEGVDGGPALHTSDLESEPRMLRYDPAALLAPPDDEAAPVPAGGTVPQRRTSRGWQSAAVLGLVAGGATALWLLGPVWSPEPAAAPEGGAQAAAVGSAGGAAESSPEPAGSPAAPTPAPAPAHAPPPLEACRTVPLDADRSPIRSVDALFRGWQELDIDQVDAVLADSFQRVEGSNDKIQNRLDYLERRMGVFGRLEAVDWTGPLHDEAGFGVPAVIDGVAVQCADADRLRVVVRYDWTVTHRRTGRQTAEQNVVDAYELGPDGKIVTNLDYAALEDAVAWRNGCCVN